MRNLVPFAVVGSNSIIEVFAMMMIMRLRMMKMMMMTIIIFFIVHNFQDENGRKSRGRSYPWGTVNIEDKNHCDFLALRSLVLAHHMQDLKDVTSQVHYEKYRCTKLTALALSNEVCKRVYLS